LETFSLVGRKIRAALARASSRRKPAVMAVVESVPPSCPMEAWASNPPMVPSDTAMKPATSFHPIP
jgi:hypothetical protein